MLKSESMMSDPSPHGNSIPGQSSMRFDRGGDSPQTPLPVRRSANRSIGSTSQSPVAQAMVTLCMLALTLAAARFVVPSIIEESRFAWRRGQLRAEYESSGDGLRDIGMESLATAYQMVSQRVAPSVVHVEVLGTAGGFESTLRSISGGDDFSPRTNDQGSGVIIDSAGFVITNHHVVATGNQITVGLSDGRRVPARVVGSDPLTDIALLQISADRLTPIDWGDSDATEVGAPVWAVGSPFGLDRTVTFGILSGKHRAAKAGTSYQDFMQSDVAVNPGNSGGPLVDSRGRLIGINTAIVGETYRGVSFSIPSNVARRVVDRLRETGRFERGWLGVELAEVPDDVVEGNDLRVRGAMVRKLVDPAAPAARAGLAMGDIIVRFDGVSVSDEGALMRMVGNWPAGQSAVLDVLRDGIRQAIVVEIGSRPIEYNLR
jgi:S1-C subfamily serine protease